MKYNEMVEIVKKNIAEGKPLHGWMRDIAIDIALDEMDEEK